VDAVCHLAFREVIEAGDGTTEFNVDGAARLVEACLTAGVSQVVLKSSTTVYGANPTNSAFLPESHPLRGSRRYAYNRHLVEIENRLAAFRQQHGRPSLAILRFPAIVGPTAETPMTRYLKDHLAVRPLGYDPVMQLIHEDDVVEALAFVIFNGVEGIYNVAAEGVLPLNRILAMTRTAPVPVLPRLADWGLKRAGELVNLLPIELDYLRFRWVADLQRMREELGFSPQYAADEAIRSMVQKGEPGAADGGGSGLSPERLRSAIEARRLRRAAAGSIQEEADNE
jgi:UDP-glucose 4-epimerase